MTATKAKIATIEGTFLTPGWSKNNRYYSAEAIGRAVGRMKEAIASGTGPVVTQLTSHDDTSVLDIVGKFTDVRLNEQGGADYVAEVPDTTKGRDMATLVAHKYAGPVSIAGNWVGDTRPFEADGRVGETGDDLDIARVDYVFAGGVTGAQAHNVIFAEGVPTGEFTDEFSGTAALTETTEGTPVTEAVRPVIAEAQPTEVRHCTNHTAEAAAGTAVPAGDGYPLIALDPDQDGDIDAWACPTCGAVTPNTDPTTNPEADTESGTEEPAVTESTPPVADAATRTLTEADVKAIADALREQSTTETPAPVEETAPAVTENAVNVTEAIADAVSTMKVALIEQIVAAYGPPPRRGFIKTTEAAAQKPLHEMSPQEFRAHAALVLNDVIADPPGTRVAEPTTA